MNTFARGIRFALFLALLFARAPLNAAAVVAVPDDGKPGKADDPAKKSENSSPATPAADSKKKISKPPKCRQSATKKRVTGMAKEIKKLQDKKGPPEPQNP
jgi:hypothetical protein